MATPHGSPDALHDPADAPSTALLPGAPPGSGGTPAELPLQLRRLVRDVQQYEVHACSRLSANSRAVTSATNTLPSSIARRN